MADNPPSVVIFEAFQNYLKWWEMLSVRLLAEWGYKLFAIPRVRWRMRLLPMDLSKPIHLPGHDIVAVHRPDDNREVLRALRVG